MSIRIIFSLFLCIAIVRAQLVQFQQPFSGQQVSNGDTVLLTWTIIGQQAVNPPLTNTNYPSSLSLLYTWTKNNDPSSTLQIEAASGLNTSPSADPARNKTYSSNWKMPNCRLFYRYPPDQYTFAFVAQPVYNDPTSAAGVGMASIQINLAMKNNNATFPRC